MCHPQVFFSSPTQNGTQRKKNPPIHCQAPSKIIKVLALPVRATATFLNSGQYHLKKGMCQRLILWLLLLIFGKVDICCTWFFFWPKKTRLKERFWGVFFLQSHKKKVPIEFVYCWNFYFSQKFYRRKHIWDVPDFSAGSWWPCGMPAHVGESPSRCFKLATGFSSRLGRLSRSLSFVKTAAVVHLLF